MAVSDIVPVPGTRFEDTLESASPDLLREMIRGFAQRMMDAEVEGICGAGYGEVTPERVNSRNGYRRREWDTRAGTVELAPPGGAGAGHCGGDVVPAGRLDPAGGEARGVPGRDEAVEVAGQRDGRGAG